MPKNIPKATKEIADYLREYKARGLIYSYHFLVMIAVLSKFRNRSKIGGL